MQTHPEDLTVSHEKLVHHGKTLVRVFLCVEPVVKHY